jgi:hypothetical protein
MLTLEVWDVVICIPFICACFLCVFSQIITNKIKSLFYLHILLLRLDLCNDMY